MEKIKMHEQAEAKAVTLKATYNQHIRLAGQI
jgi:hypothetical protein